MRARVRAQKCSLVYLRLAEGEVRRRRGLRPRHAPSPSTVGFERGCVGVETCAGTGGTGGTFGAPPNILRAAIGACERAQRSASVGTPVTGACLDAVHSRTVARAHSPHRSVNKRQMSAEAGRTEPKPKGSAGCLRPLGRGSFSMVESVFQTTDCSWPASSSAVNCHQI